MQGLGLQMDATKTLDVMLTHRHQERVKLLHYAFGLRVYWSRVQECKSARVRE